jgi:hypothetical protein
MSRIRPSTYNRDDTKKGDQLAQVVATTVATSVITCEDNQEIEITEIEMCNHANQNRWMRLYHDKNGVTYDNTTSLRPEEDLTSNSVTRWATKIFMRGGGNFAVEGEVNTSLTITIYGYIRQL